MSTVTITAIIPQPPLQVQDGDTVTFRGWYTNSFVGADGVTPVEGGNGQRGFFYEYDCSINDDGNVVIPAIEIQPTTESNPSAGFFGALFINGSFAQTIIGNPQATAGWQIPTIYGPTMNFGQLALYNAAVQLLFASNSFFTQNQTIQEIQLLAGQFLYAAVGINGIGQPSVPPAVASEPIFFGVNDPAVGNLHGTFTTGAVPRASGTHDLIASQITDDGTDVGIQCVNEVQMGDYQDLQNGSYIEVDDTAGRANLFAGAGPAQSQYAGVAAVCGVGQAQIFIQATGYTYLFGENGIVVLGDGTGDNNGTMITIDDVAQLIKLANIPTSDPAVLNALWSDSGTLKLSAG